ncbi:MAG: signal peptidase I [Velocimicrobium sp.]
MLNQQKERVKGPYIVKFLKKIASLFLYFMMAYGTARFLTDYFLQPIRVEGVSMEHTLYHNDILIVDKLCYRFQKPKRFDIVIFPFSMKEHYVKRIIAIPGETIQVKDGGIYINKIRLLEEYGMEDIEDAGIAKKEITLGDDEYFLMGDNRNLSTDSRNQLIGPVKLDKLEGKVIARIYPFDRMKLFL